MQKEAQIIPFELPKKRGTKPSVALQDLADYLDANAISLFEIPSPTTAAIGRNISECADWIRSELL